MPSLPAMRNGLWVLPIVLIVCALMVLPAGAVADRAQVSALHPSGAPAVAHSPLSTAALKQNAATNSRPTPSSHHPSSDVPSPSVVTGNSAEDQWLRSLLAQESAAKHPALVSLPNFGILEHPTGTVNPYYTSQPAPMGLGDFGLGPSGPYSFNTSHINSQITFTTEPNATAPGIEDLINPAGQNLGYVGSPFEFSIQLNTVTDNMTIPGSSDGTFWTQNVLDMNATGIHFVDDVFNLTGPVTSFNPGTIATGCGLDNVSDILEEYGGVYQCVGTTIAISSANFPLTISLYNNVTVNGGGNSQVSFGYSFTGAGGLQVEGTSDVVTFAHPSTVVANPAPGFSIDGKTATPSGLLRDAEIILGGPIGGSNAVFNTLDGSMQLLYSNVTVGGWKSVPSAYDFGTDTGETSTGVAGYWTATGTEEINAGPSFLYGLWGGIKWASVAAGDIQYSGTIDPDYGFVFVSNVAPGGLGANLTILPTNALGDFDTFLPAAVPNTASGEFWVQAFADGYDEANFTFTGTTTGVSLVLTVEATPIVLRAPLYMNGDAQAVLLSDAVLGVVTPPFEYLGLTVDLNLSFNHLNDYSFPSFTLFQEIGVTDSVWVFGVTQGNNSASGTHYYYDNNPATNGFLTPGPFLNTTDRFGFSEQYSSWESDYAEIGYLTLQGYIFYGTPYGSGAGIFFWQDLEPESGIVDLENGTYGVFIGDSVDAAFYGAYVSGGSNGVDDVGSYDTYVGASGSEIYATGDDSFGVYALDSFYGTYVDIVATEGATGFYAGGYSVSPVYAEPGTAYGFVGGISASDDSWGADFFDSYLSEAEDVIATSGSLGIYSNYTFENEYFGITAVDAGGVEIVGDAFDEVSHLSIIDPSTALGAVDAFSFADYWQYISVWSSGVGVEFYGDFAPETQYLWVNNTAVAGVEFVYSEEVDALDTSVNATGTVGVASLGSVDLFGEYATSPGVPTFYILGGEEIELEDGVYAVVNGIDATDGATGLQLEDWTYATVTNTTVADNSLGVYLDEYNSFVSITNTSVSDASLGVEVYYYSEGIDIDQTLVTDYSTGVFVEESGVVQIDDLSATNTTLSPPDSENNYVPVAAVFTVDSFQVGITDLSATNYPFALLDEDSGEGLYGPGGLTVQDLTATDDWYAIDLIGTEYSVFNGVQATDNFGGIFAEDAYDNVILGGTFTDNTWYAVYLVDSEGNYIYGNSFVGNNGATDTYSAAHIQGFSSPSYGNDWYNPYTDSGNYWADWHKYDGDRLAPYFITANGANVDYYPLGAPADEVQVYFVEYGLASGTSWSVTFNGATESTTGTFLLFGELPGTYSFTVGAVAGYAASPASGSLNLSGDESEVEADISFTAYYAVTLTETGLPAGTTWTAIVGGISGNSTTSTITLEVPEGTWNYQIVAIAGYTASPSSGSIAVSGPYALSVAFSPVTYAVTVTESGLATGTSWSATVDGVTQTSVGTSITFYLANSTGYTYSVGSVSGYSVTGGSGTVAVKGSPAGVAVAFTPTSTPSLVSSSTFNTGFAVAIAIAVIALLIGLLALFWRRGGRSSGASAPPNAWSPPPAAAGTAPAAPPPGTAGGSNEWSEGAGTPPPQGG